MATLFAALFMISTVGALIGTFVVEFWPSKRPMTKEQWRRK